jgi:hypothetical protein
MADILHDPNGRDPYRNWSQDSEMEMAGYLPLDPDRVIAPPANDEEISDRRYLMQFAVWIVVGSLGLWALLDPLGLVALLERAMT